jgi:hypothetical protein
MQVKVMVGSKSSMVLVHGHEDASDLLVEMVGYSKALQLMDGPQHSAAACFCHRPPAPAPAADA